MTRRLVVAMVAVLALVAGACGDDTDSAGSGADRPKLPFAAGGGSSRTAGAASMATDEATSAIYPAERIEYTVAEGLSGLPATAPAYRVTSALDEDSVARLAKALGVEGPVERVEEGWKVGSGERTLVAYGQAEGSWYLSPDRAVSSSGVAVACPPDAVCEQPLPPSTTVPPDLPSRDEAVKVARGVFDAAGTDVGQVRAEQSPEGWYVSAPVVVDGLEVAGLQTTVTVGSKGEIVGAYGNLVRIAKLGDYPLVSAAEAAKRFVEGWGPGGVTTMEADAVTSDAVAGGGGASGSASGGGASGSAGQTEPAYPGPSDDPATTVVEPGGAPQPEPMPPVPATEVPPEPVVRTVEITSARLVLSVVYPRCPGQELFLVPSAELSSAEGVIAAVPAVQEDDMDPAPGSDPSSGGKAAEEDPCEGVVGRPEPAPLREDETTSVTG